MTPVLQWFHLNFGAGNFRGRRPGTSALRMLLRLTAVKSVSRPVRFLTVYVIFELFISIVCSPTSTCAINTAEDK